MESLARAAEPLLGSALVGELELEELLDGVVRGTTAGKSRISGKVLEVGVRSVDEALEGGLEEGCVVGVSSEGAVGAGNGSEVCLALLTNALLREPPAVAAVVDTTGNLDVLRIFGLIVSRLQSDTSFWESLGVGTGTEVRTVEDAAAKVLDRVKILRVFDVVGVMEAVGEIRDGLEGRKESLPAPVEADVDKRGEKQTERDKGKKSPAPPPPPPPPLLKRTVVADSEDEDDEEILFENEADVLAQPGLAELHTITTTSERKSEPKSQEEGRISFILIDNLAHVINPLLKKDYIQAHALSTSFLVTLSHLTHMHKLHTILLNPATMPRPLPQNMSTVSGPAPRHLPPPPPSIFSSNKAVPALMGVLNSYLDLHLMISRLPKTKADARMLFADGASSADRWTNMSRKGPDMVSVVEVVSDRWRGRTGAWGTFVESEKGIKDVP